MVPFRQTFLGVLVMLVACGSAIAADPPSRRISPVVATEGGRVRGVERGGVLEFRGIPYAAAPVGKRRWRAPLPHARWKGIRNAASFGPACAQVARYGLTEASEAEDCLTLNISRPATHGPWRPVIVWIHGGAFVGGSSNLYRLDALARGDAVVVSISYRLGALGFLAHPAFGDADNGVYGLEDQRAALRWIKRNIAAFGGDPDRITLAGESAGAGSICMHLATPDTSTGLFQRVIVQSAACLFPLRRMEDAKNVGLQVAALVGCSKPKTALKCLQGTSVKRLLDAAAKVGGSDVMALAPSVGSAAFPTQPAAALLSGAFVKADMLAGATRDEMRLYVGYDAQAGRVVTKDNYAQALEGLYGANWRRVAETYVLNDKEPAAATLGSAMSDFVPVVGIGNCLQLRTSAVAGREVRVYQYEFADRAAPVLGVSIPAKPDPGFELGAVHSAELNYLFPNFSNKSRIDAPDLAPESQKLADMMIGYWTSFARTGRPEASGAPDWPTYRAPGDVLLLEPGRSTWIDADSAHRCAFWRSLYPAHFGVG